MPSARFSRVAAEPVITDFRKPRSRNASARAYRSPCAEAARWHQKEHIHETVINAPDTSAIRRSSFFFSLSDSRFSGSEECPPRRNPARAVALDLYATRIRRKTQAGKYKNLFIFLSETQTKRTYSPNISRERGSSSSVSPSSRKSFCETGLFCIKMAQEFILQYLNIHSGNGESFFVFNSA